MWGRFSAGVVAAFVIAAPAGAVTDGKFTLLDRPAGFGALPFDGVNETDLGPRSFSADGRYVVFSSSSDVLPGNHVAPNVYRYDTQTHAIALVSAGTPDQSDNFNPSISANGARVAWVQDLPAGRRVLVKDFAAPNDPPIIASRAQGVAGAVADEAGYAVISGDGDHVLFQNRGPLHAVNADATGDAFDAYVRTLSTGRTVMASVKTGGTTEGGGTDTEGDISFDGKIAAIRTNHGLVAGDMDGEADAYVISGLDTNTPAPVWASFSGGGQTTGADDAGRPVALSADGATVGWVSDSTVRPWISACAATCSAAQAVDTPVGAENVEGLSFPPKSSATAPAHVVFLSDQRMTGDAGDTNATNDVFSRTFTAGAPTGSPVRLTDGVSKPFGAFEGQATDNLAKVVFASGAPNLPGGSGILGQIYLRQGSATTLISQPFGQPARAPQVLDTFGAEPHEIADNGVAGVFHTRAPAYGTLLTDHGRVDEIMLRNMVTGAVTMVSTAPNGAPGDDDSSSETISGDGTRAAFRSEAKNLVPGVTSGIHVYVRDLPSGAVRLVDKVAGAPSSGGAVEPSISHDGRKVVFLSSSPDLPGAAPNRTHVYEADLASGTITLVDKLADGTPADASAEEAPDLSGDGNRVAFQSLAANLGGGSEQIYVKDLATGTLTWVSRPQDGVAGHSHPFQPSISADGQHVAFLQTGSDFGFGATGNGDVFVHDLPTHATTRVSVGSPASTTGDHQDGTLNADGTRVSFVEFSDNAPTHSYVRDRTTNTTINLDRNELSFGVSIDATGHCFAVASRATDWVSPSYGPDFDHVFIRAAGGDCPKEVPKPPDTTRPVISKLRMTHRRFRVKRNATAFKFSLSENAATNFTIARRASGRRKGKHCVKPTRKLRHRKRCTRYLRVTPSFTKAKTHKGANKVVFSGKPGGERLKPGHYRATLVATDLAGNRSKPKRITFTVRRKH